MDNERAVTQLIKVLQQSDQVSATTPSPDMVKMLTQLRRAHLMAASAIRDYLDVVNPQQENNSVR